MKSPPSDSSLRYFRRACSKAALPAASLSLTSAISFHHSSFGLLRLCVASPYAPNATGHGSSAPVLLLIVPIAISAGAFERPTAGAKSFFRTLTIQLSSLR